MHISKSTIRLLLIVVPIIPFLVGFNTPDSSGTYVKLGGGKGAYRFTPGCSNNRYKTEYTDWQVNVDHRWKLAKEDTVPVKWYVPAYVNGGAYFFNEFQTTSLVTLVKNDSAELNETVGNDNTIIVGAHTGLDWRWFGLDGGFNIGNSKNMFLPTIGLRLGDPKWVYASAELMGGQGSSPLYSGGGAINWGIGTVQRGTNVWAGVSTGQLERDDGGPTVKVSHTVSKYTGFVTVRINEMPPDADEGYAISGGLQYRIPDFK